ncbi:MAG: ribosome-associated translation inhibitor RaiA [Spirochaetales bacterium]|nr:ribosome-associated translation inhibitor RaiA [Spirochaetales bacterium]
MRLEIKGVHYDVTDVTRDFLQEKLTRLDFAADQIVDLLVTLTKGKKDWSAEATINFRFGVSAHISETDFNLHESIEKMVDRLENKIRKEKDKVQDHHK